MVAEATRKAVALALRWADEAAAADAESGAGKSPDSADSPDAG